MGANQQPRSRVLLSKGGQCVSNTFIIGLSVEVPAAALVILVDLHEPLTGERREVLRNATIGLAVINAFQRGPNFEVACLAGLTIRVEYNLKIALGITTEARGDVAQPLALSLSARDTGLDPLDRATPFFLGDSRTDVSNELSSSIWADLTHPTIRNCDGRVGRFASFEEALIDAPQAGEPRDLPDDDVVVLAGFDRRDEIGELLATRVRP